MIELLVNTILKSFHELLKMCMNANNLFGCMKVEKMQEEWSWMWKWCKPIKDTNAYSIFLARAKHNEHKTHAWEILFSYIKHI
jgi:hypothetical protein